MGLLRIDRTGPDDAVAVVCLDRPERRNALSAALRGELWRALRSLDADAGTRAVVLTGADPAFCAGVDLTEIGSVGRATDGGTDGPGIGSPVPRMATPLIGAVNGPAVTGGLEVALRCDFLIASERARFADTHARVGLQPTWGITTLLPAAVGRRMAAQMSFTGDYVDAEAALVAGLVNEVVAHDQLLPRAIAVASTIAACDPAAVQYLRQTYHEAAQLPPDEAMDHERARGLAWIRALSAPEALADRRHEVIARGRSQLGSDA